MMRYPAFMKGKSIKEAKAIVSLSSAPDGECDNEQQ